MVESAMSPSYGEPQVVVMVVFAVIALALALTFALVARQASKDLPFERVRDAAYRLRRFWLAFLVTLLSAAVGLSLFFLPYSGGAAADADVAVSAGQFYWSLSPKHVPAGTRVRFDVTSVDVNHGFGIYAPDGELLGSVQAMPGYTNHLELTLDEPGSYLISCLEFCGLHHHLMSAEFKVGER
jgi:cytochrome c oxidase subunit 2